MGAGRVYLNRSLAMVLEQKGVPQSVMINLQERMVHGLVNRILYDNEVGHLLRVACPFLRLPYEQFHKAGFPIASDPFFRTLISVSCQRRLGLLREKANVAIPDDKGRHMFGVLDEKKLLKPTEVFVQYTLDIDNKDSSPTVICQGQCVVCPLTWMVIVFCLVLFSARYNIQHCLKCGSRACDGHQEPMSPSWGHPAADCCGPPGAAPPPGLCGLPPDWVPAPA
ncbi:hypothetical protein LAZ67_6003712 [Cordylochernes scorpioides]|uniref:RNA-dependent RNA polymerase n=1 Tax=Cordylochernes scorpioides TaxID=51811 RepID=A0ABY6KLG1_9ARAC|nr:hypothetical protein LAZ67_6003712 [Cordylochernes scorpioides]